MSIQVKIRAKKLYPMGDFLGRKMAADLPGKSIVQLCACSELNYVTMEIYPVSLLPPSVEKSPIVLVLLPTKRQTVRRTMSSSIL